MKKALSITLVLCMLLGCLLLPAAALVDDAPISVRLNSDVAGCTEADADKMIEIRSPQVVCRTARTDAIDITDAARFPPQAPMEAGRTYYVTYTLEAAEGYALPDALTDDELQIECGKGVSVIYYRIVDYWVGSIAEPKTERVLEIVTKVVVDGTVLQRIIGWFSDLILKIRSWQLY